MKARKKLRMAAVGVAAVLLTALCVRIFACPHKEIFTTTVKEATCTQEGQEDDICMKCNAILESRSIPVKEHDFEDCEIEEEPGPGKNGILLYVCKDCGTEDRREFECPHDETDTLLVQEPTCGRVGRIEVVCEMCGVVVKSRVLATLPHETTYTVITKEPTCYEMGIEAVICEKCENVVEEHTLGLQDCSFGDWLYTKYATPFDCGERYKECTVCGKKDVESYTITMEENSIYIPGTGINNHVAVSYFTQSAVNNNDVVYTEKAYAQGGENNPFVLWHWYGSLRNLYKTEIGQNIYLYINGKIETYKVVVSEYAVEQYDGVHMFGQTTGTNIWDTFSSVIPSKYAVFGNAHDGKDLWESDNDGKTLHIYTCHNNKAPWKPGDGRRGRWMVMAVLV